MGKRQNQQIDRETPRVAEIRRRVRDVMEERGVVRAGVFGSVIRGTDRPDSDVDFLVEFEDGRTLLDLAGLRLDLAAALGCEVDVATPRSLHPELREEILRQQIRIL